MKCSRCNSSLKETDYHRKFGGRTMCKNCYPKFLKHVLKNDAQKKLERDKLKDPEFERLLYAGLKNLQSLYSFYKKDFDQSIADVLITRKDKDGYFFERIAILLEQDDFTDLVY